MRKRVAVFLMGLILSAVCVAQKGAPTPHDFYKYPDLALGIGFETDFSLSATSYSVPVELRLFSVENRFNFALGERVTFRRPVPDENPVFDYTYYCTRYTPYINYEQYTTYLNARWNIVRYGDSVFAGLFVGAGFLVNVNANAEVFIDAPSQGPWLDHSRLPDHYTWQEGVGRQTYRCDELLNRFSYALRLELGFTTPGFEVTLYGTMALTTPVNFDVAGQELYYDRSHRNDQMSVSPVTIADGGTPTYLPIRLADYAALQHSLYDRVAIGFSVKAHLFTGYWAKLFRKQQ